MMGRRYFISQYPTFGRATKPNRHQIEASPYYFWWLALTYSTDYIDYCENFSVQTEDQTEKIQQVYEDFGDVRYVGNKYQAFAKWWKASMPNGETRGAYLFAEPLTERKVELVKDVNTAEKLLASDEELVIRVSKGMRRAHIDKALDRIFDKEMHFERGRQTRNPNRSNARYRLVKPITIDSLQMSFAIYALTEDAACDGIKLHNYEIAKRVGLKVKQKSAEEENWDRAYFNRVVSVAVSRKKKIASDAIANVVKGVFP